MYQKIGYIALLIPDYEEAKEYYAESLGFAITEDSDLGAGKRWVVMKPRGPDGSAIVLAEAKTEEEKRLIGNQGAGRVWLFLHTDDFDRDYQAYRQKGIQFLEEPRHEPYGTVAVFQDKFGNKWDLLELKKDRDE